MTRALTVEWLKMRRSPVTLIATTLMALALPGMGLGFFEVGTKGGSGSLALKAGALIIGEGWVGYLGAVSQIAAVAVFVGSGVVVAWVFGREHVDRTFPALFALPVTRKEIARAKLVVLTGWTIVLSAVIVMVTLALGLAAGVGPISGSSQPLVTLWWISLLAAILALPLAWVASAGKGYLPVIGVMFVIVAVAQVVVLVGGGSWFPYAVPGLLSIASDPAAPHLNALQIALAPLLALLGAMLTVHWWNRAEVV